MYEAFVRSMAAQHGGKEIMIGRLPVMIGRTDDCDLQYDMNTRGISRHHCTIAWDADSERFIVEDQGSSYGTFLSSGERLEAHRPYRLRPGERIILAEQENTIQLMAKNVPDKYNYTMPANAVDTLPPDYRPQPLSAPAPVSAAPSYTPPTPVSAAPGYTPPAPVTPYSTGGLVFWGVIVVLFLSRLCGIVALVKTAQINQAATVEEQQQRIQSAKNWCIAGTIIGVILILIAMAV